MELKKSVNSWERKVMMTKILVKSIVKIKIVQYQMKIINNLTMYIKVMRHI